MGLERPNVLGVSFGGTLALELAARHPQRLDTLTVQGAGAQFERSLLQQVAGLILSRYPLPSKQSVRQSILQSFVRQQAAAGAVVPVCNPPMLAD